MEDEKLLLEVDDGLPMRESGSWVYDKLYYLSRYIDIFETSMKDKWQNRAYIDLFSGPGKCVEKISKKVILGSPLIALNTRYPFTEYYFVDLNKSYMEALIRRCSSLLEKRIIFSFIDDSNKAINEIIPKVKSTNGLNLAFLDPEGLELHWDTVIKLASVERMDLIIYYPQMGLTRQMPNEIQSNNKTSIDYFFGDREWRGVYKSYQHREEKFLHRKLLDHYKDNLQKLGYRETKSDEEIGIEPLMVNRTEAPLYRLLFASKHPLGHNFWRKIMEKDPRGQRRLF